MAIRIQGIHIFVRRRLDPEQRAVSASRVSSDGGSRYQTGGRDSRNIVEYTQLGKTEFHSATKLSYADLSVNGWGAQHGRSGAPSAGGGQLDALPSNRQKDEANRRSKKKAHAELAENI
jgi:hypothetical protein